MRDKGYTHWRHVKGDGNCFYRSTMFGYIQNLIMKDEDGTALKRFKEKYNHEDAEFPYKAFTKDDKDLQCLENLMGGLTRVLKEGKTAKKRLELHERLVKENNDYDYVSSLV